jgi:hypothetical protein
LSGAIQIGGVLPDSRLFTERELFAGRARFVFSTRGESAVTFDPQTGAHEPNRSARTACGRSGSREVEPGEATGFEVMSTSGTSSGRPVRRSQISTGAEPEVDGEDGQTIDVKAEREEEELDLEPEMDAEDFELELEPEELEMFAPEVVQMAFETVRAMEDVPEEPEPEDEDRSLLRRLELLCDELGCVVVLVRRSGYCLVPAKAKGMRQQPVRAKRRVRVFLGAEFVGVPR